MQMNKWLISFFIFLSMMPCMAQDMCLIKKELYQSAVLNNHVFGFSLYDIDHNRFLLGHQEDKHFTPASNTKIFTLFTALQNLGDTIPALHYIERGDSLIFWSTGDPTFLHPKLDVGKAYHFLASSAKKLYYAADVVETEPFYRMGWAMEDYDAYYQPEVSTFPIYGNVATFREEGNKLRIFPARFQTSIAVGDTGGNKFEVRRSWTSNTFLQNGHRVPKNYVTQKPFRYTDTLFKELLQDTLRKAIEIISYSKPTEVDTLFGAATRDVLREMMLVSDNFLAEQLLMVVANHRYGTFNTVRLRKDMAAAFHAALTDQIDLYDGSGLSPYNKVTPRSIVELLLMIAGEVPDVQALRYLFAAGGREGTLKNTYQLDRGVPFVWAKTGTLKGVYCLSGYIQTRSGRHLAFSFLHNNFVGPASPVRQEVARIITAIRKNY